MKSELTKLALCLLAISTQTFFPQAHARESAAKSARRPVVITTDCGTDVDDQWAIVQAAISPRLKVLAVIGNFAPNAPDTKSCAREALRAARMQNKIPALKGAQHALLDRTIPIQNEGVRFLLSAARGFSKDHRLLVLGFGTGTDVASALLIDPSLADRIEYHALAFNRYPEGTDGWNVTNDIRAYQVILDSRTPVTLINGNLADERLTLKKEAARELVGGLGKTGHYLARIFVDYIEKNADSFPEMENEHWPIWDTAVVAPALGFANGELLARPLLNDDESFAFPNTKSRAPFRWITELDREGMLSALTEDLRAHQSAATAAH